MALFVPKAEDLELLWKSESGEVVSTTTNSNRAKCAKDCVCGNDVPCLEFTDEQMWKLGILRQEARDCNDTLPRCEFDKIRHCVVSPPSCVHFIRQIQEKEHHPAIVLPQQPLTSE